MATAKKTTAVPKGAKVPQDNKPKAAKKEKEPEIPQPGDVLTIEEGLEVEFIAYLDDYEFLKKHYDIMNGVEGSFSFEGLELFITDLLGDEALVEIKSFYINKNGRLKVNDLVEVLKTLTSKLGK